MGTRAAEEADAAGATDVLVAADASGGGGGDGAGLEDFAGATGGVEVPESAGFWPHAESNTAAPSRAGQRRDKSSLVIEQVSFINAVIPSAFQI